MSVAELIKARAKDSGMSFVVVDIDGTMSLLGDRVRHLTSTPRNWDAFLAECIHDKVNEPIARLVWLLGWTNNIVFCTARSEDQRDVTVLWLQTVANYPNPIVLMRPSGDKGSDTIVKPEQLASAGITPENTHLILEDRTRLAKKWRELGFTCLQVADGDF